MQRVPAAPDPFAEDPFIGTLRRAGARSPTTACPRAELPPVAGDLLAVFVASGVVRDAGGERYYLLEPEAATYPQVPAPFTPRRVTLMMAVWVVVLLVSLIMWLVAR